MESVLDDLLDFHVIGDFHCYFGKAILQMGRAETAMNKDVFEAGRSDLLKMLVSPDTVALDAETGDRIMVKSISNE